MATVVLKLFAGQGTLTDGQTNGQSSDYMLPPLRSIKTSKQFHTLRAHISQ